MIEGISYLVGDATDPQPTDTRFLEYAAAEEDAFLQSAENVDVVIAIWEMHKEWGHATTHRLVFQGSVWYPSP